MSDLLLEELSLLSLVVSKRQLLQVSHTAQVWQETAGAWRPAAPGFLSQRNSEKETDSAASLRDRKREYNQSLYVSANVIYTGVELFTRSGCSRRRSVVGLKALLLLLENISGIK